MTGDSRTALAAEFFRHYFAGDVRAAGDLLDTDAVYILPGRSQGSGKFQGLEAIAEHLRTFLRLNENAVDVLHWEDWLTGVNHVAGLVQVHLQREGQEHVFRLLYLVVVSDRSGRERITRIEAFCSDQAAFDRFFAVEP